MLTINTKIAKYMASLSMALLTKRIFTSTSNLKKLLNYMRAQIKKKQQLKYHYQYNLK